MTDTYAANTMNDMFRNISAVLFDKTSYWLLGLLYQIFFNVASADLFNNATILGFYKRVQLIIGVFMIFQLAVTIMRGILNPDQLLDNKSGVSSFITRVVMALVLLTVLVPINIPGATNEYERQLNNNGLLFGTLYSLQNRILSNNTLGRLILGTTDGAITSDADDDGSTGLTGADKQAASLEKSSKIFTSTILKGFVRINLVPEEYRKDPGEGKTEEMLNENRICKDIDDAILESYTRVDADVDEILSNITADCALDTDAEWVKSDLEQTKSSFLTKLFGKKRYMFAYRPIISAIVAIIFCFVLLSFTIEIAVRAVKLAVLRLIAPVPIISYMDPKGSKDGAFNSWVKTLTSTYLDLFIRLAVIYFVIYLIQDMIVNGIVMNTGTGMIGVLSAIIIWIGLFMFAREAPKFIRQVLGMKEDAGRGLFSGIGTALGMGAAAAGMVGSALTNYKASKEENEQLHAGQTKRNIARNVGSAITGAISGGFTGARAALTAKDHALKSSIDAMQKRNAIRASHSTALGRLTSSGYGLLTGNSLASRDQNILDANKNAAKSIGEFKSMAEAQAKKNGEFGTYKNFNYNYEGLMAAMNAKDSNGNFQYTDAHTKQTRTFNVRDFDNNVLSSILDSQTANYLASNFHNGAFNDGKLQDKWAYAKHDMIEANIDFGSTYLGADTTGIGLEQAYKTIGATIGEANAKAREKATNMEGIMHRANEQQNKK